MQYLLPVSKKFRDLWKEEPPPEFAKASSDYVRFHAETPEGPPPAQNPSHPKQICYAVLRPGYDKYNLTCMPLQKKNVVDLVDAYEFMNSFTEAGLLPEGIQLWGEKDGVHCYIPAGIGNPHNIYAAVVAYRWIDSCPALVWEYLRIMNQEGDRHPLQVLPYLHEKYKIQGGHSFMNVATYGSGVIGQANNPTLGVAAKIYFDTEDPRGSTEYKNPSSYVNTAIGEIAKQITPTVKIKSGAEKWASTVNTPQFVLEKSEDSLHPDLYPLYTIPKITTEQVSEILSPLFTKEKK